MQQGSIIQAERKIGPDVWEFRWREPGPNGKRKHRRMVIGRSDKLADESAARGRIAALHLDINFWDARLKGKPLTISELAEHYRQRELKPDTVWKTYSTKVTYEGYLSKWILPRWGNYLLASCGRRPYWAQSIMRHLIRPAAAKLGITERVGWHTFRHYAESETMPSRDSETLWKQLESWGYSVWYSDPCGIVRCPSQAMEEGQHSP